MRPTPLSGVLALALFAGTLEHVQAQNEPDQTTVALARMRNLGVLDPRAVALTVVRFDRDRVAYDPSVGIAEDLRALAGATARSLGMPLSSSSVERHLKLLRREGKFLYSVTRQEREWVFETSRPSRLDPRLSKQQLERRIGVEALRLANQYGFTHTRALVLARFVSESGEKYGRFDTKSNWVLINAPAALADAGRPGAPLLSASAQQELESLLENPQPLVETFAPEVITWNRLLQEGVLGPAGGGTLGTQERDRLLHDIVRATRASTVHLMLEAEGGGPERARLVSTTLGALVQLRDEPASADEGLIAALRAAWIDVQDGPARRPVLTPIYMGHELPQLGAELLGPVLDPDWEGTSSGIANQLPR